MKPITLDKHCYRIGNTPVYLYSGEFHYFRVPKSDWRKRMELLKEAGGNCLAAHHRGTRAGHLPGIPLDARQARTRARA